MTVIKKVINLTICLPCLLLSSCASMQIKNIGTDGNLEIYDDEARLWRRSKELQEVLKKSGYIYQDKELTNYVNDVLHKLMGDFERINNVQLEAYIVKDPLFNAFCLPDGVIYVHTSILANADNEAQLATVLAHEASHFLYRHSLRQQRDLINKTAFLNVLGMTLGAVGASYGTSADLANLLGQFVVIGSVFGYSREMEREADENAFELVKDAGYTPLEAKELLENLFEATKDEKKISYFYSRHPEIKERIKTYEDLIKNLSKEANGKIEGRDNTDLYNKMIKKVLLDNAELDMKREKGLKNAKRQIERYNKLYPDDAMAYCLLGKLCVLENNKEQAEQTLKKSIELNPNYPQSHRELGLLYYKDGKKQLANVEFERYLELEPDAKDAEYIGRYLNE